MKEIFKKCLECSENYGCLFFLCEAFPQMEECQCLGDKSEEEENESNM